MADEKSARLVRRFYKLVSVDVAGDRFQILLDGRPVKTPGKNAMLLATKALAEAVSQEWSAQGEKIDPLTMPLTQIACTSIDRVGPNRTDVVAQLVKYAESDLLCYRAQSPQDLVQRQAEAWQPILDWANAELGAEFKVTDGIIAEEQPADVLEAVRLRAETFDDHQLASVSVIAQACSSIVIALGVAAGRVSPEDACAASQLDEAFQSELWGQDREAEDRLRALRDDIYAAAQYLTLHSA